MAATISPGKTGVVAECCLGLGTLGSTGEGRSECGSTGSPRAEAAVPPEVSLRVESLLPARRPGALELERLLPVLLAAERLEGGRVIRGDPDIGEGRPQIGGGDLVGWRAGGAERC